MNNIWTVRNGFYIVDVDVDKLGLLPIANVRKLLKLSATGEHPEDLDALAQKLANALQKAAARVKEIQEKNPDELLGPIDRIQSAKYKKAMVKQMLTEAKRNLTGLKKVLEVYGFENY
jgi:hypothetical protein